MSHDTISYIFFFIVFNLTQIKGTTMSKEIIMGNLYKAMNMKLYDYVGFTSNSTLNKKSELIMGLGTAKVVKDKFPKLPSIFGKMLDKNPNFMIDEESKIFAIRTKDDWKNNSKVEYIEESLRQLVKHANKNKRKKYAIPVPGVNNGGLKMKDVMHLLDALPKNIDVWRYPEKVYTGVGSRDIPVKYALRLFKLGRALSKKEFICRSGGASGSDLIFEESASGNKEIYLPWKGFNKNLSPLYTLEDKCYKIAKKHHKGFDYLKPPVQSLMARNVKQILGNDCKSPTSFVICYTNDGCNDGSTRTTKTGGTGLAISLASSLGITVFNVKNDDDYLKVIKLVNRL